MKVLPIDLSIRHLSDKSSTFTVLLFRTSLLEIGRVEDGKSIVSLLKFS